MSHDADGRNPIYAVGSISGDPLADERQAQPADEPPVVTPTLATERAVASLLDVVEELCVGLAHGATPTAEWAEVVESTFAEHRRERRAAE